MSKRQSQAVRRSRRAGRPRGSQTRAVRARAAELVALVVAVVKQRPAARAWREPL